MKKSTILLLVIIFSMSIMAQKKPSNVPTSLTDNMKISVNTVTDIDGNIYNTVKIGTQIWMVENLKTTKYNDGTSIPLVSEVITWPNLTTPCYCFYNNDNSNKITYGALYNWHTVNTGKLSPTGWHVPTDVEWTTLENFLIANGYNYDGTTTGNKIAKSMAATTGWATSGTPGAIGNDLTKNNSSGFAALPGGFLNSVGAFGLLGRTGYWWSSTESSGTEAWFRALIYYNPGDLSRFNFAKSVGSSVRCIRNPLIVNAGSDKSLFCDNMVQLDSVTTNFTGLGTLKYKWYPSAGLNNDSVPNPIATVDKNTTYTVIVSFPDGFTEQDSVQVLIKSLTANAGTDKAIVCGGSVQLGLVTSNYTGSGILKYKWTPSSGLNNDSISNPIATVTDNITYKLTVTTPNGCTASDIVQVTVNPLIANAGVDKTFVCGTTSQLDVTTNYTGTGRLRYKWVPSEGLSSDTLKNPIVHSFKTMSYTVTITTPNGCTATDIVKVQPSVSLSQKIRLVGVDSNNKNTIVWNVVNPDFVDSVNIYKESDITDVFMRIGIAPYSASSYVDSLSNPKEKSNRYKITLRDKCGFETQASEPHKTMHLTINQGQNNSWNLILEPYDGFVVSTYKIYRGTSPESLSLLSSMAGSSYQFSDYNPPLGFVYYQVEVMAPSTQFNNAPSQLRSETVVNVTNLTSSKSNIATNNTTGVNCLNTNNNFFTVSPNPAKEVVILAIDNFSQSTVKIYDMVGRLIKIESVSGLLNYINISNLPSALYVFEVRSGNKIGRQRLVIKNQK